LFLCFLLISASSEPAYAQKDVNTQAQDSLQLQRDRFEFDKRVANYNLELQRQRLEFDQEKRRSDEQIERSRTRWSALATTVPVIAALLTIVFGVWNYRKQAELQFEIKAAEIAFSRETPLAVVNRARALKKMFGKRLPKEFPTPFDLGEMGGNKEDPEAKKKFLELLLEYPDKQQEIVHLWLKLFNDDWLQRVNHLKYGLGKNRLTEDKKLFIELILKYPEKKKEIIDLWVLLFDPTWPKKAEGLPDT
jgi:hypothetical protein